MGWMDGEYSTHGRDKIEVNVSQGLTKYHTLKTYG
jgi:hypothetical protein